MVDRGEYFSVNKARQYGKTTTLNRLAEKLSGEYIVFLISFEGIEDTVYENTSSFCQRICRLLYRFLKYNERMTEGISEPFKGELCRMQSDHAANLFGFIKEEHENIVIANRIFETQLYNLFISEELLDSAMYKSAAMDKDRNMFIRDGRLDMEQVLVRFTETFTDIYSDAEERFLEENGRRYFLLYLKPIINGIGNYYIEARTRNMRRTDVIIDFRGEQFVCELKIWHGEEYNRRGEDQLLRYLEDYHLTTGYMLSFNFNKKKKTGVRKIRIGERTIIEAVV